MVKKSILSLIILLVTSVICLIFIFPYVDRPLAYVFLLIPLGLSSLFYMNFEKENSKPIYGNEPMTVGDWLLTYLTLVIPIVNIVMLFIWAFSSNTNDHKSTWAEAFLIWLVILFTLYILVFVIIFSNSF